MSNGKYSDLLKSGGFHSFLWTQFLGAFNDNVYKFALSFFAFGLAVDESAGGKYVDLLGAAYVLPFLLFSGYAGQWADIANKRGILIITKFWEIGVMVLALFTLSSHHFGWMLAVMFLTGVQATFFSPAKYGIVPEMVPPNDLSRANGLLEMSTFVAIVLGTTAGGLLRDHWKNDPSMIGLFLISIAVLGTVASFKISKVPAPAEPQPFRLNPFVEISHGLRRVYREKVFWLTVLGISYFWFLGALLQADLIPLGKQVMSLQDVVFFGTHITDSEDMLISFLAAFLAVGIGAGSMAAGKLSGEKVELGLVPLGSIGIGVFSILLPSLVHSYWNTGLCLAFLGFSAGLFIVPLNAFLQHKSGDDEKGRVLAANNFMNTVGMLLAFLALFGLQQIHLAPHTIILVCGGFSLLGTLYLLTLLPDFLVRFSLWALTHTIYRIKLVGQENMPVKGPALLVCNHISFVDGLLVGSSVQRFIRFMIWKPYYDLKWFHWLFRLMRAIPIDSRRPQEVMAALDKAREELRQGHVVCIFAEGSISRTGNMLPFKRGFEKIMEGLDVPIIPVQLDRLWGSIFSFKEGRFITKWPESLPYPVTISYGKPLSPRTKAAEACEAVLELGSDAIQYRRRSWDVLPLRFLKASKRRLFSFAMADSSGKELTRGKVLIGSLLLAQWVKKNCPGQEKVGLLLPSSVGGALANLGLSLTGKVPVNLNFTAGKENMESAIQQCGIRTILTSKLFLQKAGLEPRKGMVFLEDILQQFSGWDRARTALLAFLLPSAWLYALARERKPDPGDLATVIFSSGSTGTPKGVMLSHANILSNVEALEQLFWVTKKDNILGVLPFFHSFGYTATLWFPLVAGFGAVYHPNPLDAKTIGGLAAKYKITILISTPTFYSAYIKKCEKADFASVRFAVVGAEKLREGLAKDFKEKFGQDLMEGYGCTEMAPVISVNTPDYLEGHERQRGMKPGTVGHPVPGVAVKVVDPGTGETLPPSREGLLLVRGPNRMMGYLGQPEKTGEVFRDGWYVTGDIALLDEDGFIRVTDRLSRFSKIGGEMVPHGKVEETINDLLEEHACAVTSVPDEQKGEKLVVFYDDPGKKPEELWAALSQSTLPKLWIPKKDCFYFVEALPLLGTGKLDLKRLKQMAAERASSSSAAVENKGG